MLHGRGHDASDRARRQSAQTPTAQSLSRLREAGEGRGTRQTVPAAGCNECHGGNGGGGGICPALTQGAWFWGNTDDVLFRLITVGSVDLEKQGYKRLGYGSVHAPMPPMGAAIRTSDELWKIIAFIRSINPPGTNPPDTVLPKE
jgi:mono/diheme cytochrome c family protein